ncbi:MAG: NADPH:quinone oxidoreductase family protein [Acidimicrobiia bacterium]|nr:NADPH:quinone oxidoreductase family protein [Acidimicrobiia bacterium]
MRAWQVVDVGEPTEVMRLVELAEPVAGPGEVVVAVEAVGVSFPDLLQVRGHYQIQPELPFVPGREIAGTIAAVGGGVHGWRAGDRVLLSGRGGLAERCVTPAAALFATPRGLDAGQASALVSNYGTAWFALHCRAALQPGEILLVHAGAGGVGSAAIQLGRACGAMVIATAGGPHKVEVARTLGADVAIDYDEDDFVDVVMAVTDGHGADVVFDPVGGDVFDRSRRVVAWGGRLLVIGFTSGRIADAPTNHALLRNYSVVGVYWGGALGHRPELASEAMVELASAVERGEIDPLVGGRFALADAPHALAMLGSRRSVGKLVVEPLR